MKDVTALAAIMASSTPSEAKAIGRRISPWVEELWQAERFEKICLGTKLKFSQNAPLYEYLLQTGDAALAEAAPHDRIWGIGLSIAEAEAGALWRGMNLPGRGVGSRAERSAGGRVRRGRTRSPTCEARRRRAAPDGRRREVARSFRAVLVLRPWQVRRRRRGEAGVPLCLTWGGTVLLRPLLGDDGQSAQPAVRRVAQHSGPAVPRLDPKDPAVRRRSFERGRTGCQVGYLADANSASPGGPRLRTSAAWAQVRRGRG